jgi:hypothetical protein
MFENEHQEELREEFKNMIQTDQTMQLKKKVYLSQALVAHTLATQEADIRRIIVQSQSYANSL